MRKSLMVALLPVVALSGCALVGGGRSVDARELGVRRTSPLVIPPNFNLPPPSQPAASAAAR